MNAVRSSTFCSNDTSVSWLAALYGSAGLSPVEVFEKDMFEVQFVILVEFLRMMIEIVKWTGNSGDLCLFNYLLLLTAWYLISLCDFIIERGNLFDCFAAVTVMTSSEIVFLCDDSDLHTSDDRPRVSSPQM